MSRERTASVDVTTEIVIGQPARTSASSTPSSRPGDTPRAAEHPRAQQTAGPDLADETTTVKIGGVVGRRR
jgi:hypothetical protein